MRLFYESYLNDGMVMLEDTEDERGFVTIIENANVINIQNVHDYMEEGKTEYPLWNPKAYPILAPPHNQMWFEYRDRNNIIALGIPPGREPDVGSEVGILTNAIDLDSVREHIATHPPSDDDPKPVIELALGSGKSARWMLSFWVFINRRNRLTNTLFGFTVNVNADGSVDDLDKDKRGMRLSLPDAIYKQMQESEEAQRDIQEDAISMVLSLVQPALMAISLMHCKNVEQIEYDPDKVRRGRRFRGGKPKTRHHTLRIKQNVQIGNSTNGTGSKMAMHIARGHFKTFTDAAPLLGKHVGTYWWSPQMRGRATRGTVTKDYEIETEQ